MLGVFQNLGPEGRNQNNINFHKINEYLWIFVETYIRKNASAYSRSQLLRTKFIYFHF